MNATDTMSSRALTFDRRRARAMAIVGGIMQAIRPHLHPDDRLSRISDAILELMHEADAEIITKHDRAEAGLPDRNEFGLSPEEHRAIEDQRLLLMTRPVPPLIMTLCPKCGEAAPADTATKDAKS